MFEQKEVYTNTMMRRNEQLEELFEALTYWSYISDPVSEWLGTKPDFEEAPTEEQEDIPYAPRVEQLTCEQRKEVARMWASQPWRKSWKNNFHGNNDSFEEDVEEFISRFHDWPGWTAEGLGEYIGIEGYQYTLLRDLDYVLGQYRAEKLRPAIDEEKFIEEQAREIEQMGDRGHFREITDNPRLEFDRSVEVAIIRACKPKADVQELVHAFGAFGDSRDAEDLAKRALRTWEEGERYQASAYHTDDQSEDLSELRVKINPSSEDMLLAACRDLYTQSSVGRDEDLVPERRWEDLYPSCSEALAENRSREFDEDESKHTEFVLWLTPENIKEFVCDSNPELADRLNRRLNSC